MKSPVRTRRKNAFNLFRESEKLSSFDEFPMLRPEVDPQLHLSRNAVDQPFHLSFQKDTVIGQFSGRSRVEFTDGPIRFFDLGPGDFSYVPAGATHRVKTVKPGVMARYKANDPGKETVYFFCDHCGNELDHFELDASQAPAQQGYQAACEKFNQASESHDCAGCGSTHAPVDMAPFRWQSIVEKLQESDDD